MDLGEDLDWFLRARDTGVRIVFGSEVVLSYRVRPGSLSARREEPRAWPPGRPAALGRSAPTDRAFGPLTAVGPTMTVLMPVLNGEPYLAEALAALRFETPRTGGDPGH